MTAVRSAVRSPAPARLPAWAAGLARRPWGLYVAIGFVAVLAVAAIAPQVLARYEPTALNYAASLQSPSWTHWFGTDESGRDLYSRVIYGARESLLIGLGAAAVGIVLALSSARSPRWPSSRPRSSSTALSRSCSPSQHCCWRCC